MVLKKSIPIDANFGSKIYDLMGNKSNKKCDLKKYPFFLAKYGGGYNLPFVYNRVNSPFYGS